MLTRQNKAEEQKQVDQAKADAEPKPHEERIEDFLAIDPMEIEIGAALVKLASPKYGGDLLPRITAVRQVGRGRHRHHPAQGPHSRQHPPRRERVPHQDRQQPRRSGRSAIPASCWPSIRA